MKMIKVWALILLVAFMGCQDPLKSPDTEKEILVGPPEVVTNPDPITEEGSGSPAPASYSATGAKVFPFTNTSFVIAKPSNKTQSGLNDDVQNFYDAWKARYVESSLNTPGGFIVRAEITGQEPSDWVKQVLDANGNPVLDANGDPEMETVPAKTQSEAHGYGMVISAYMGDKVLFDGLLAVYKAYPSMHNKELMSWIIPENEDSSFSKSASATDGDLDIAYGLLLAHEQWGSNGTHNYLAMAKTMIDVIKAKDFNPINKRPGKGDWQFNWGIQNDDNGKTRPSDWMVTHFKVFYSYTSDPFWLEAIDEVYDMIMVLKYNYSPVAGLLPDFVEGTQPQPLQDIFENITDDDFSWNSCRYPWRIGMDYGIYGDLRSKQALSLLLSWAMPECNYTAFGFMAGYKLDGSADWVYKWENGKKVVDEQGNDLFKVDYSSNAFYSPLAVAASHDVSNDAYLKDAWSRMTKNEYPSYFGDTITMQCMLYMSGNWWVPDGGQVAPLLPKDVKLVYTGKGPFSLKNTVDLSWYKNSSYAYHDSSYIIEITKNFGTLESYVIEEPVKDDGFSWQAYTLELPDDHGQGYVEARIKAKDTAGNVSEFTSIVRIDVKSDNIAPSTPTDFKARHFGRDVRLYWSQSTDNVDAVSDIHYEYKMTDSLGNTTTGYASYSDFMGMPVTVGDSFTIDPNITHWDVSVRAYDKSYNFSPYTPTIRVSKEVYTTQDTEGPTRPGKPVIERIAGNQYRMTWTESTDPSGIDHYLIFVPTSKYTIGPPQFLTTSNYYDFTLAPGTKIVFAIKAVDTRNNLSMEHSAITFTSTP